MFKIILITVLSATLVLGNEINEDSSLDDFFKEKQVKFNEFFQKQLDRLKQVVKSTYVGIDSQELKKNINKYIDDQNSELAVNVNKFVENLKNNEKKAADIWSSFMPTEDPISRLENPEMALSVPGIITRNGYQCETHTIVSQGYILNVHRLPNHVNGNIISKNTVILQHGLLDTSFGWIINGPEKSLAYVLADAGYDVWLTNVRGNPHAREHAWYKTNSKEFWNFSFHDMAAYDMPAVIDYIRQLKGNSTKIAYIGHSMGTMILFTMLSLRPEYNKMLSTGIALAPAAFLSHMDSPLKSIGYYADNLASTAIQLKSYEFFQKDIMDTMSTHCKNEFGKTICKKTLFYYMGDDEEQYNHFLSTFFVKGSSTSWKNLIHLSQMVNSGKFRQFDYGRPEFNKMIYGSTAPLDYDLSQVKLNLTLFYADNDLLANEKDVLLLYNSLPHAQLYKVPFPKFNHVDFLWAKETPRLINDKVLAILRDAL